MAGASGWRYSTVSVTFWNDLKVRDWTDDDRLVALYLLTNPHRSGEGFYHLPLGTAADDLGWPLDRVREALARLQVADFAEVDERARLVLVVKALKWVPAIRGKNSIPG